MNFCHFTNSSNIENIKEEGLSPPDNPGEVEIFLESQRPESVEDIPNRQESIFMWATSCEEAVQFEDTALEIDSSKIPEDCKCAIGSNSEPGAIKDLIESGHYCGETGAVAFAENYWEYDVAPCDIDECNEKRDEINTNLPIYERGVEPEIFCECTIPPEAIDFTDR